MNYSIKDKGIEYCFCDKWCRWNNFHLTYDIENNNFRLCDISLNEESETIMKTYRVKKLFRTINEQRPYVITRFFIILSYVENSGKVIDRKIEISDYQKHIAYEIYNYLKNLLKIFTPTDGV